MADRILPVIALQHIDNSGSDGRKPSASMKIAPDGEILARAEYHEGLLQKGGETREALEGLLTRATRTSRRRRLLVIPPEEGLI